MDTKFQLKLSQIVQNLVNFHLLKAHSSFESKQLTHLNLLQPFSEQRMFIFLCLLQSYRFLVIFMKCALCQRDSIAVKLASFKHVLRQERDQEAREIVATIFADGRVVSKYEDVGPGFLD